MGFRAFALLAGGAAVTAALWFAFKPPAPPASPSPPAPDAASALPGVTPAAPPAPAASAASPTAATAAAAAVATQVFELTVAGGRLVSGPALMQVHQGDPVRITVRSDASDELHLHGYDIERPVGAGQTASLQFTASHSGRFGLELHKAHAELGALEVYPR